MSNERLKKLTDKINGGGEPSYNPLTSDKIGLINGLNFYAKNHDTADSKKWALAWLKKNHPELGKKLAGLKDYYFINRGFLCRMIDRGFVLSPEQYDSLFAFFKELADIKQEAEKPLDVRPASKTSNIPTCKINVCMQSLDDVIEAAMEEKAIPALKLSDKKAEVQEVADYCERTIAEMNDHKEYYDRSTIKKLKPVLSKCQEQALAVLKTLESKKTIAVLPKKVNPSAMVKNVRFQKEDKQLGLKSVSMLSVVGARKMYAYDTKNRKLRVYVSNSAQGFVFSGTTLKNFDPHKSVCKTVRKPEKFFAQFTKGITMSALNSAFKELTTVESKIESGGRFNENLIVLKVATE
jgi:hypothetical protein